MRARIGVIKSRQINLLEIDEGADEAGLGVMALTVGERAFCLIVHSGEIEDELIRW